MRSLIAALLLMPMLANASSWKEVGYTKIPAYGSSTKIIMIVDIDSIVSTPPFASVFAKQKNNVTGNIDYHFEMIQQYSFNCAEKTVSWGPRSVIVDLDTGNFMTEDIRSEWSEYSHIFPESTDEKVFDFVCGRVK